MRLEVTRNPTMRFLLKNRWPQFILTILMLAGFILAILAGLIGTPVGNRNFSIVFTWIAWWAVLMLVAVPFLGRGWCAVCPIPIPGEWLQRGKMLGPDSPDKPIMKGLNLRWPNKLRNIWLQNGMFVLMAIFSTVILTTPGITAVVLAAFLFIATGTALIFERRAFCRYLCPVGGFIGIYSQTSPLELRVIDTAICAADGPKACYNGSAEGYGCPWQVFPPGLVKNTYCGLCMECLRTCPNDNIAVYIRNLGEDLPKKSGRKIDEAFKSFIMLASALVYAGVLLGPWGQFKTIAYSVGTLPWAIYILAFLLVMFVILPGVFWICIRLGQNLASITTDSRRAFIKYAYALIPLGLIAWIAFSLSFVFTNAAYIMAALSDPFGWGWDLFGSAQYAWTPFLSSVVQVLQIGVLVAGLLWSVQVAVKIAGEELPPDKAKLQALPISAFSLGMTVIMMGLLL